MYLPDWRQPQNYSYTASLCVEQWAWEFLRRNKAYQQDWRWFWATWQSLEARYGKPPERDFQRWERDPDAYRMVDDTSAECRVDQDKMLIECWMGAKWGFYKFPLDPATRQPVIGEQLTWREADESAQLVEDADSTYLHGEARHVALGFELDLPLRRQLELAKRFLQLRQARLRREGKITMRLVSSQKHRWCVMLRMLDGLQAGDDLDSVYAVVREQHGGPDGDSPAATLLHEAEKLVNGGYREMLRIPAKDRGNR
ncbi:MAG: DUF6499 domain-containing protein [Thiogranum sp.]